MKHYQTVKTLPACCQRTTSPGKAPLLAAPWLSAGEARAASVFLKFRFTFCSSSSTWPVWIKSHRRIYSYERLFHNVLFIYLNMNVFHLCLCDCVRSCSCTFKHPGNHKMALSGASLHTAYHSITSRAVWLGPMCKTAVERPSAFSLIDSPLRNVFSYSTHFYQKYRNTHPLLSCKIGPCPSMTWWSPSGSS